MKIFLIPIFLLLTGPLTCSKQDQAPDVCYKGRLSIKGICMNYVIEVIEGDVDKSLIVEKWTHPTTGIVYQNAFALESICTFPSSIQEGDEFYFHIPKNPPAQTCAQCQAYSAVPDKSISIDFCNN